MSEEVLLAPLLPPPELSPCLCRLEACCCMTPSLDPHLGNPQMKRVGQWLFPSLIWRHFEHQISCWIFGLLIVARNCKVLRNLYYFAIFSPAHLYCADWTDISIPVNWPPLTPCSWSPALYCPRGRTPLTPSSWSPALYCPCGHVGWETLLGDLLPSDPSWTW